jgi:hypothetical protein
MQSFRVKLPALWRQTFPALVIGASLAQVINWLEGQPWSWPPTLLLMGIAAVMVLGMHWLQPTQAGPQGLRLMGADGLRRAVRWDEIVEVRMGRMHGLQPALRIIDRRGRSLWLPRDTHDLRGLHALALHHGGAEHPLTRALATPLYAL